MLIFILSLLISYILTSLFIPIVINKGYNFGLLDQPSRRKQHDKAKVRLGGIAIVFSFLLTFGLINIFLKFNDTFFITYPSYLGTILSCGFLLFLIGIGDDVCNFSPLIRLLIQIIIAIITWSNGIRIESLRFDFIGDFFIPLSLNSTISLIITSFWIVGIINAFNWLDGLDGQLIGLNIIYSTTLVYFCLINNMYGLFLLLIINIGCSLSFLRYNFFPSKILMGDGGAYFIGYFIASLSIIIPTNDAFLNIFTPILILLVPISDMILVVFSRIYNKSSPFYPDRRHFHYRLIDEFNISHRSTVLINYALNIIICFLAIIIY